jgi:hypothetical protein
MSADDSSSEGRDRRLIREAKEQAFHARRQVRQRQPSPDGEAKRQLAVALADYRDVLSDYRDERALETDWEKRDVDVDIIDDVLARTTTSKRTLNRRGSPTESVTVQLVEEVDPRLLIDIGKELDAIAKELGFAAAANDPTPSEEADKSDLRGLLRARDQGEALNHLGDDND